MCRINVMKTPAEHQSVWSASASPIRLDGLWLSALQKHSFIEISFLISPPAVEAETLLFLVIDSLCKQRELHLLPLLDLFFT